MMDSLSGVGVLDKAVLVLDAVAVRPCALAELVTATGLPRATAHRIAAALEAHRLLDRDAASRWVLGSRWSRAAGLATVAQPVLDALRDETGESAQLFVRRGDLRVCVAAADRASGLRDTVAVGAALPLTAGSGAQVLVAFGGGHVPRGAAYSAATLAAVRRRGWAASVAEREPGVASVSAPVLSGEVLVGAVSVSGPVERLGRAPGRRLARPVTAAAQALARGLAENHPNVP